MSAGFAPSDQPGNPTVTADSSGQSSQVGRPRPTKTNAVNLRFHKNTRFLVRWVWISFLFCTGMIRWARRRLTAEGGVVVLTFHRVLSDSDFTRTNSPAGMIVRENTFASLAQHMARHYTLVDLAAGIPDWKINVTRPRVALTFDDGWSDNASTAFPIARKQDLPWTIFICPDRVGRQFPFWPERVVALWRAAERRGLAAHFVKLLRKGGGQESFVVGQSQNSCSAEGAVERLKTFSPEQRQNAITRMTELIAALKGAEVHSGGGLDTSMTWSEIEGLSSCGVTFGSHTLSHSILTGIPLAAAEHEVAVSKRAIERRLRRECRLFAYPNGDWSAEVRAVVAGAGYQFAFANRPGVWARNTDPLLVPRVNVWEGTLVGASGRFSRRAFEYAIFWKTWRSRKSASHRLEEKLGSSRGVRPQLPSRTAPSPAAERRRSFGFFRLLFQ